MSSSFFLMKIEVCQSYETLSMYAKDLVVEQLSQNKSLLLCAATGGSPTRMYELLVEASMGDAPLFAQLSIIKLDEWGGLPMSHPGTCESYLQQHLIQPLAIPEDRYISFQNQSGMPEKECERIQQLLAAQGPIDICILGIGLNGHIALNEPATTLHTSCHVATLTDTSLQHPMIADSREQPAYGLTLGMADILQSKKIILLINGSKKAKIAQEFLSMKITTELPASFLWLHPDVTCFIDREALPI
jgi:galactosamine-6-phosphate isomerase